MSCQTACQTNRAGRGRPQVIWRHRRGRNRLWLWASGRIAPDPAALARLAHNPKVAGSNPAPAIACRVFRRSRRVDPTRESSRSTPRYGSSLDARSGFTHPARRDRARDVSPRRTLPTPYPGGDTTHGSCRRSCLTGSSRARSSRRHSWVAVVRHPGARPTRASTDARPMPTPRSPSRACSGPARPALCARPPPVNTSDARSTPSRVERLCALTHGRAADGKRRIAGDPPASVHTWLADGRRLRPLQPFASIRREGRHGRGRIGGEARPRAAVI